jgi:hypothetical protein
METRYGSFRALWVLDKNDPFIRGDQIKALEGKTGYMLHEVETRGEPLVHLTTRTRPEIVLFGADQKLSAPLYLTAGKNIMVTAQAGADKVSIRRFSVDRPDERREAPLNVADVIRAVSELDGTYPDVVQMLMEAAEQNNLQGRFAHDALPEAGRMYERPAPVDGAKPKSGRKTRIGRDNLTPNIFPVDPSKENDAKDADDLLEPESSAMANVKEDKTDDKPKASEKKSARKKDDAEKANEPPPKKIVKQEPARPPGLFSPRVHKFSNEEKPPTKPEKKDEPKSEPKPKSKPKPGNTEPDISESQSEP